MRPSATDFLHGLRRLWWVLLVSLLVGIGLGYYAAGAAQPTATTSENALFTIQTDDAGDQAAGTARGAEAEVAQSRLAAYVQIARSSPAIQDILLSSGFDGSSIQQLLASPVILTAGERASESDVAINLAEDTPSLVAVKIQNGDLDQTEASELVTVLTRAVVDKVTALDAQQETPSLRPDVLVTEPQQGSVPSSPMTRAAVPVVLLLSLGLAIVYLLVWWRGKIYDRRDIESRLGARVLGDMDARPSDAPAIVLALCKGRRGATTALLVPVGRIGATGPSRVGEAVAAAGQELGLEVHRAVIGVEALPNAATQPAEVEASADPGDPQATTLTLVDACAVGLGVASLHATAAVDIVALIVEYGETSFHELTAAGRTVGELTEAEIAVIGVHRKGVPMSESSHETNGKVNSGADSTPRSIQVP